ncbi:N-acetylneuraminate synthase family protein [Candidatus Pelagibacter sp. HIMB1542]|uniref:N-acetylneuraminate synthase family protein n=1 Tax=Candidatus Pelagibacter sp. HIMB1542 TaxID=3413346 RepID=UPI003F847462
MINKIFNPSYPILIPEIGINHFSSLRNAKKIVDSAYNSGSRVIKAQVHIPEKEMSLEAKRIKPGNSNLSIYEVIEKNSFKLNQELELKKYIEKKKMLYIASSFCQEAAIWLHENGTKVFKIGSGECGNIPFVKLIASFNKPTIMSTGMHEIKSLKKSVNEFKKRKIPLILMHCVNLYPTKLELSNLGRIKLLQKSFPRIKIGLSDHTAGLETSMTSIAMGVKVIEKHFVSNKKKQGPDVKASIDEKELNYFNVNSKKLYTSIFYPKKYLKEEQVTRKFAYHSVVAKIDIKKDEILSLKNLCYKRPGTGDFHANKIFDLIGKRSKKNIKANTQIKKNYV